MDCKFLEDAVSLHRSRDGKLTTGFKSSFQITVVALY